MRVLLVPSGGIAPVNSIVGTSTAPRLAKAVELYKTGRYDAFLFSGGQCHSQEYETQPAAYSMEQAFREYHVQCPTVMVETLSRDTYENLFGSLVRLKAIPGPHEITVVTHWQQALRFKMTAKRACGLTIHTAWVYYPTSTKAKFEEVKGLVYHYLDRYGDGERAVELRRKRSFAPGITSGALLYDPRKE